MFGIEIACMSKTINHTFNETFTGYLWLELVLHTYLPESSYEILDSIGKLLTRLKWSGNTKLVS